MIVVAILISQYIDMRLKLDRENMKHQHEMIMSIDEEYDSIDAELVVDWQDEWENMSLAQKRELIREVRFGDDEEEPEESGPVAGFTHKQLREMTGRR